MRQLLNQSWKKLPVRTLTLVGVLSILMMLGLFYAGWYTATSHDENRNTVVVFDLKKTYGDFIQQTRQMNLNPAQMKSLAKRFNVALENSLKTYAKRNHCVIVLNSVALAGSQDITDSIQQLIAKHMQSTSTKDRKVIANPKKGDQ